VASLLITAAYLLLGVPVKNSENQSTAGEVTKRTVWTTVYMRVRYMIMNICHEEKISDGCLREFPIVSPSDIRTRVGLLTMLV